MNEVFSGFDLLAERLGIENTYLLDPTSVPRPVVTEVPDRQLGGR